MDKAFVLKAKCENIIKQCRTPSGYGAWDSLTELQRKNLISLATDVLEYIKEREGVKKLQKCKKFALFFKKTVL